MDVDYYIEDFKNREYLDILRPPVKRNCRPYVDHIGYVLHDSENSNKIDFVQNKSNKTKSQRAVKSSLSLVLQKICKKQIYKDIKFKSNNLLLENHTDETNPSKPTIQITVIPKKGPDCLYQFLETKNPAKRKNKKDNTCEENNIATENIYLVVAGKKDKIYEIRASNNIVRDTKDVRIESKRFSSKMEKKKKKSFHLEGKREERKCFDDKCYYRPKDDLYPSLEDEYPPGSSRVRIVGRIGLNEEDKYVMNCSATVNGQPVKTNYASAQPNPVKSERVTNSRQDKVTEKIPITRFFNDRLGLTSGSRTSQATQVDTNMQVIRFCSTIDRNTQCNLCELCNNTENNNFDKEFKATNLNRTTSPLVIISVYPKSELKYGSHMDTTSANRFDHTYASNQLNKVRTGNFQVTTDLYNIRDISLKKSSILRCCPCEAVKKNDNKEDDIKPEKNIARTNRASRSLSPAKRSPKYKRERKKDFIDTNTAVIKTRSPSPERFNMNNKTNQRDPNSTMQTKKVMKRVDIKKENETPKSKLNGRDKSVNTVIDQTARFSKKVTDNKTKGNRKHALTKNDAKPRGAVLKKFLPQTGISKVSINIDSDREHYDVIFEKGSTSTDLIVKRTAKDKDKYSQKHFEETFEPNYKNYGNDDKNLSDSLENFFPVAETGHHRRSASQAFINENIDLLTTHTSRLNVRDSLEIGHRRDHASKGRLETAEDFYAPEKHFPGDDCLIDPIERDKEIRELLGIDKKRKDNERTRNTKDCFEHDSNRNNAISHRYYISHSKMCKSSTKKPIHNWPLSPSLDKHQDDNSISIPRKDEEKSITDDEKYNLIKLGTGAKVKKPTANLQNRDKVVTITKQRSTQCVAQETAHFQRHLNPQALQKQKVILLSNKQYRKVKKLLYRATADGKKISHVWNRSILSIQNVKCKRRNQYPIHFNKNVQTESLPKNLVKSKSNVDIVKGGKDKSTVVLFRKGNTDKDNDTNEVRKVPSSIEIRYTSIAYSEMGKNSAARRYSPSKDIKHESNLVWKNRDSIETIFKGHKKTFTPNLGTSSLSLLSEEAKSTAESLPAEKPRKPFLRRLMSCLVMRSETTTMKLPVAKLVPTQTRNSSVDSYHISTSLVAMDMTSSIYDTSASFYSNHTIGVLNNKTKRGFFSSVREFLSAKKN